jgi:hypothetical protein
MKLLLIPMLLLGAGMGGYGLLGAGDEIPATCDDSGCRVEVECTDRNTCIVTCYDADGDVRCQNEIACDEPCEKECQKPCEAPRSCPQR